MNHEMNGHPHGGVRNGASNQHAPSDNTPTAVMPTHEILPAVTSAPFEPVNQPSVSTRKNEPISEAPSKRSIIQTSLIMTSLCACIFVAALDVTIIATALPAIAGHFRSASGYTWVGSAYTLAYTVSTPSCGKISDIWGRKPILLATVAIFFAGSLVCAVGNELILFLAGRVIQGIGAGGMITLVNICISDLFSLRDRGMYFAITSVVWAFASGIGPVLGGIFTQKLTFRWCFYINLPITASVFLLLYFTLHLENPKTPVRQGLRAVDWTGSLLVIGSTLMVLLGLNFGGVTYPWNSITVICLIVFGVCVGGLFILSEWKVARYPIIPLHLFNHRSNIASFSVCFMQGFIFMGIAYYLPLYFQAVLGTDPLLSGVYLLPFILSLTVMAAITGLAIQKTGKYIPMVSSGLIIMTLGTGLLIDLEPKTEWPKLIMFQIVAGIGVGLNFEPPLLALQARQPTRDVATATATIGFVRSISTAISVIVGGVVFQNQMAKQTSKLAAELGPQVAGQLGANAAANVDFIDALPTAQKMVARQALNQSLRVMWIMYTAFAAMGVFSGFFISQLTLSKEHQAAEVGLLSESMGMQQSEIGKRGQPEIANNGLEMVVSRPGTAVNRPSTAGTTGTVDSYIQWIERIRSTAAWPSPQNHRGTGSRPREEMYTWYNG